MLLVLINKKFFFTSKGRRVISRKMVLLVTDGQSNSRDLTISKAKALKGIGIDIYVVAVGSHINGIDEDGECCLLSAGESHVQSPNTRRFLAGRQIGYQTSQPRRIRRLKRPIWSSLLSFLVSKMS